MTQRSEKRSGSVTPSSSNEGIPGLTLLAMVLTLITPFIAVSAVLLGHDRFLDTLGIGHLSVEEQIYIIVGAMLGAVLFAITVMILDALAALVIAGASPRVKAGRKTSGRQRSSQRALRRIILASLLLGAGWIAVQHYGLPSIDSIVAAAHDKGSASTEPFLYALYRSHVDPRIMTAAGFVALFSPFLFTAARSIGKAFQGMAKRRERGNRTN